MSPIPPEAEAITVGIGVETELIDNPIVPAVALYRYALGHLARGVGYGARMYHRSALGFGLGDGQHGLQGLVFHLDFFDSHLGYSGAFGQNRRDPVADMPNLPGEHRLIIGRGFGESLAGASVESARGVEMACYRYDTG